MTAIQDIMGKRVKIVTKKQNILSEKKLANCMNTTFKSFFANSGPDNPS